MILWLLHQKRLGNDRGLCFPLTAFNLKSIEPLSKRWPKALSNPSPVFLLYWMSQTTSLVPNRPPTKKASWGQGWVDLGYFECDVTSKPSFAHSDSANSHPTSPFQLQSFMRRLSGLQTRSHDTRLYSHSRTTKNSVVKVRHHSSWSAPCASTLINQYYNTLLFQNAVIVSIRNVQLQSNSLWGYHLKCEDLTDRSRKSNRNCLFREEVPKHLLFGRELNYCLVMMHVFSCCF